MYGFWIVGIFLIICFLIAVLFDNKKLIMKILLIVALVLIAAYSFGQEPKPKEHVFYDTIKTTKVRVDYSPDTIPVYFKELAFSHTVGNVFYDGAGDGKDLIIEERWKQGFVIWQTYRKPEVVFSGTSIATSPYFISNSEVPYYKVEYEPSHLADGKFLYMDKKPVTNKVIFSIKR